MSNEVDVISIYSTRLLQRSIKEIPRSLFYDIPHYITVGYEE